MDVALAEARRIQVFPGTARQFPFSAPMTYTFPQDLVDFTIADFRGQGQRELAAALDSTSGSRLTYALIPNGGRGTVLAESASSPLSMRPSQLIAADINADGRAELMLLCKERHALTFISGSSPNQAGQRHYALGKQPQWLGISNVLGDARSPLDVLVADSMGRLDPVNGSVWILEGISAASATNQ